MTPNKLLQSVPQASVRDSLKLKNKFLSFNIHDTILRLLRKHRSISARFETSKGKRRFQNKGEIRKAFRVVLHAKGPKLTFFIYHQSKQKAKKFCCKMG